MSDMIKNVLLTFTTGVEIPYTVPINTGSIAFHAVGGDAAMMHETGGDEWTISQGEKESIDTRQIATEVIYFSGNTGTTLQMRLLMGVLA